MRHTIQNRRLYLFTFYYRLVGRWEIQRYYLRHSGGSSHGRTGRPPPPIDQKLGLVMAARHRNGGKFSLKSLTFGHFLCKNLQKAFSFRWAYPHQGLYPWTPLGALPPDPRLGSRSARSPWSPSPMANPGSATAPPGGFATCRVCSLFGVVNICCGQISRKRMLQSLHWLPIRERILYKTALLTFKTRLASPPPYVADLL